jgi:predicted nuclease with TOPRIM domain
VAEIHLLPARLSGPDQTARIVAELLDAQEQNVDLGSRAAHIKANAEALQSLNRDLSGAIDALLQTLSVLGVQDQHARDMLHRLLSEVQKLVDKASRYPSGVTKS